MRKNILALLLAIAMAAAIVHNTFNQQVYAHNFTPDESASFLFLIDQLTTEVRLVQSNLLLNNTSLAQYHADRAVHLLDANTLKEIAERNQRIANDLATALVYLQNATQAHNNSTSGETLKNIDQTITDSLEPSLQEAVALRIDEEQLNNSTVRALSFSLILNQIDMTYANAYGIESTGMQALMSTNNNNSRNFSSSHTHSNSSSSNAHSDDSYHQQSSNANNSIVQVTSIPSLGDYQTARALSVRALKVYSEQLRPSAPTNATAAINDLGQSLIHLNNSVENMVPPIEVVKIIHGNAQNALMKVFNLELGH